MKKFEYKCIWIWKFGGRADRTLTEYGRQGWELAEVFFGWHYLKREVS